jgi:hypothetical protein
VSPDPPDWEETNDDGGGGQEVRVAWGGVIEGFFAGESWGAVGLDQKSDKRADG